MARNKNEGSVKISTSSNASRPATGCKDMGKQVVSDVLQIFKSKTASKLRTKKILKALWADAKKPWATYSASGSRMGAKHLSSLLKGHGIVSRNIRFKRRVYKGYRKQWFVDARRNFKAIKNATRRS